MRMCLLSAVTMCLNRENPNLNQVANGSQLSCLEQVTGALVRMTASAPSAVVRAKSALALSLLLDEMKSSTI